MTVIVYREPLMAADSQATNAEGIAMGTLPKLVRHPDGSLAGMAGHAGDCLAFREWFLGGRQGAWCATDKEHGFAAIVVDAEGEVLIFEPGGRGYPLQAPFFARGAGAELAIGAMAMGARADQAVAIACRFSVWCGGEIQTAVLGGAAIKWVAPVEMAELARGIGL
jgi:hypothetical protein